MTTKKAMKHYLIRLKREAVRLYQEITELPGRGFAPGLFPLVYYLSMVSNVFTVQY
jgi:hypothetical protein